MTKCKSPNCAREISLNNRSGFCSVCKPVRSGGSAPLGIKAVEEIDEFLRDDEIDQLRDEFPEIFE